MALPLRNIQYAKLYNKDGVTRHLNYYETHEHEYVYQETKKGTTIVLGFYKIENGQVIDEHTTAWHYKKIPQGIFL